MVSLHNLKELWKSVNPPQPTYTPKHYPDLRDKTVAITGTTSGIGLITTKLLIEKNAKVIVFNRDPEKVEKSIKKLKKELPSLNIDQRLSSVIVDLADLTSFNNVDSDLKKIGVKKLDIVILNAGVMTPPSGSVTKQGYELQMGINCLGHFLLMKKLHKYVKEAATCDSIPRVLWLSSIAHNFAGPKGGISYKESEYKNVANNSNMDYYGRSKAGTIYQAAYYAQLHQNEGIMSLSVHPGGIRSELSRHLTGYVNKINTMLSWPPEYGAYTELYAALNPDISLKKTGEYVGPFGNFIHVVRSDISEGRKNGEAKKFWEWCEKQVAPYA